MLNPANIPDQSSSAPSLHNGQCDRGAAENPNGSCALSLTIHLNPNILRTRQNTKMLQLNGYAEGGRVNCEGPKPHAWRSVVPYLGGPPRSDPRAFTPWFHLDGQCMLDARRTEGPRASGICIVNGADRVLLSLLSVSKSFPGVRALNKVSLDVRSGEVHGLVGENGAGKSTLMAIASGALIADEGQVVIDGQVCSGEPDRASAAGLSIVHQEPLLMPDLTVAENLYLGIRTNSRPSINEMQEFRRRLCGSGATTAESGRTTVSMR